MQLGIIGLPSSGKTTVFNALTGSDHPTGTAGTTGRLEINTAVIDVPEPRLEQLNNLLNPKKFTFAKVAYTDVDGIRSGDPSNELPGTVVNALEPMDGLLHVVRLFENLAVSHSTDPIDGQHDLEVLHNELLLHDMLTVERGLERLLEERQKGGRDRAAVERDQELFTRLAHALEQGVPLRSLGLSGEDGARLAGYGLLTLKPMLILYNLSEGQLEPPYPESSAKVAAISLYGKLEMEIAQLASADAQLFMEEYDITEPSLNRMIRNSYVLMKLQSFFTVGEDEVRAWTVRQGAVAPEAAGTIHSDLQKGFIRAEVIPYGDLVTLGSMSAARSKGKLRLEGKEYLIQDGDIMHVRFNV